MRDNERFKDVFKIMQIALFPPHLSWIAESVYGDHKK